jgi:hypothetical protein
MYVKQRLPSNAIHMICYTVVHMPSAACFAGEAVDGQIQRLRLCQPRNHKACWVNPTPTLQHSAVQLEARHRNSQPLHTTLQQSAILLEAHCHNSQPYLKTRRYTSHLKLNSMIASRTTLWVEPNTTPPSQPSPRSNECYQPSGPHRNHHGSVTASCHA